MKKSLFVLPFLFVASLTGCGGSKTNLAAQALDSFPMLIDFSTGKEINIIEGKQEANDLDSFLGLKSLYWQETNFKLEWKALPEGKWNISDYPADETRLKFLPLYGDEAFECSLNLHIETEDGKQKADATWTFDAAVHQKINLEGYTYISIEELETGYSKTGKPNEGKYYTFGYITGHMEDPDHVYSGVYLGDGEYGTQLYAGKLKDLWSGLGLADGDLVVAAGVLSPYKGLMEIKPDAIDNGLSYAEAANVIKPVELDGNNLSWGGSDKGDDAAATHQCSRVSVTAAYVSGKVESVSAQGYMTFKTSDNKTISISANYHIGTKAMQSLVDLGNEIAVGDVYTIKGVISVYDGDVQIIPLNGALDFTKASA